MKTAHSILTLSLIGATAVAIVGCNRDRDRSYDSERTARSEQQQKIDEQDKAGSATLTGASWVSNDNAIDRIVASRCAREMTCTNVGPDKHFTTSDACVLEVRKRMRDDLKTSECPAGIDAPALDKCLDSIRSESCTNPLDTLGRLAACRSGELCLKAEGPRR